MRVATTVLVLLLLLCQRGTWADEGPVHAGYMLKQDVPDTESRINRVLVGGSEIPFDKRYSELTAEQQNSLKSQYERMGPGDEPPFPVNGLGPIFKALAIGQQRMPIAGPMTLFVQVNSQGQATSVSVLQSPDPEVTKFAASILMLEKYKPALCEGTPCTMQFPVRIMFSKHW